MPDDGTITQLCCDERASRRTCYASSPSNLPPSLLASAAHALGYCREQGATPCPCFAPLAAVANDARSSVFGCVGKSVTLGGGDHTAAPPRGTGARPATSTASSRERSPQTCRSRL